MCNGPLRWDGHKESQHGVLLWMNPIPVFACASRNGPPSSKMANPDFDGAEIQNKGIFASNSLECGQSCFGNTVVGSRRRAALTNLSAEPPPASFEGFNFGRLKGAGSSEPRAVDGSSFGAVDGSKSLRAMHCRRSLWAVYSSNSLGADLGSRYFLWAGIRRWCQHLGRSSRFTSHWMLRFGALLISTWNYNSHETRTFEHPLRGPAAISLLVTSRDTCSNSTAKLFSCLF